MLANLEYKRSAHLLEPEARELAARLSRSESRGASIAHSKVVTAITDSSPGVLDDDEAVAIAEVLDEWLGESSDIEPAALECLEKLRRVCTPA